MRSVANLVRRSFARRQQLQMPDASATFDEEWYLATYPDVALAVRSGIHASGHAHFLRHGRREGRSGSSPALSIRPDETLTDPMPNYRAESYLSPDNLRATPLTLRRTMVIGTCLAQTWALHHDDGMEHEPDFFLASEHTVIPDEPPRPARDYDFILVHVPLRDVIFDGTLWRLAYNDVDGYRRAFDAACLAIDRHVEKVLKWTVAFGLPAFVANFMLPQADLTGRLLPRYDLRNIVYFTEELNRYLERSVRRFKPAYILDVDRISASLGRRYIQDDVVLWVSHGSVMPLDWPDEVRIEAMPSIQDHYEIKWRQSFVTAIWAEATAMYRSLRQVDMVKLVVVDLDDTLWMGVSGDDAEIGPMMIEGWPLGIAETLMYLKKRGILLAIISKNDEERIRSIWPLIFRSQITLDDFAIVKIDWKRKSDNMADILRILNVLPESAIFVDDNPVERAEMQNAYPGMRILGRHPFYVRRTLLWSAETQTEDISTESASRTQMVHAQVQREAARETLSREDFLATLGLIVTCYPLTMDAPRFKRAFELLNKTNQFNTTGRRWTFEDLKTIVEAGARLFAFDVQDKFTAYGLVGLCIVEGSTITQFVMSCRVNGLDVELAVLSTILRTMEVDTRGTIMARFVETKANLICRDLWARCGFDRVGEDWIRDIANTLEAPAFIKNEVRPM